MRKHPTRNLTAALALSVLAAVACGRGPTRVPEGTPIVLISIDTLRADRLPAYGYGGVRTPAIDALVADGIVFEQAFSHAPTTLPSHVSLFSGLLPNVHGVRDNVGYRIDAGRVPLLQTELHRQGYATGAAVSSFVLRAATGFSAGFDFYDDRIDATAKVSLASVQRDGPRTLAAGSEWLRSVAARPFFFFLHLYEPHTPYEPPEPYATDYADAYDGEIAAADRVVGDLVAELRRMGVYDRAIVLLVSDHGEGLGEHGEDEHGVFLYRSTLHVPLVVKLPHAERAGSRVSRAVQLVDVLPTLCSLLALDVPEGATGSSLLADERDLPSEPIYAETYYPRLHFGWSELRSLQRDGMQYIEAPTPELYDLVADPGQTSNLVDTRAGLATQLRDLLADFDAALEMPGAEDAATREQLAALGYIGSAVVAPDESLPDPKDRLETLRELRDAHRLFSTGDLAGAVVAFRDLLERSPRLIDGWERLGRALEQLGRPEEALAAYERAIGLAGGEHVLALSAAELEIRLGRLAQARAHAGLAARIDAPSADVLLAQIALREGTLDEAERLARRALAADERRPAARLALAEVLLEKEQYEEALDVVDIRASSNADPELLRGLGLLRGRALANLGDASGAESAFLDEITRFPDELTAYSHLAGLYAMLGKQREVAGTLRALVANNPQPAAYLEAVRTLRILRDPDSAAKLLEHARALFPEDPLLQ